jgi:N-acyl-D-aspartate/D-glutamate deacylase
MMRRLLEEGLRAGALGFSTSRTLMHRSSDGRVTPMYGALRRELVGLAHGMSAAGGGILQMVSDFMDVDAEHGILVAVARIPGCRATYSLVKDVVSPTRWRKILDRSEDARYARAPITAQVFTRPIGVFIGLDCSLHPFMASPTYLAIADLPLAERVHKMRRPEVKKLILGEKSRDLHPFFHTFGRNYDLYFELGDPPSYEPGPSLSIAAKARVLDRQPLDVIYDALLEDDGRAMLYFTLHNFGDRNLDSVREMMAHDDVVYGLGDGGAHVASVCDASGTTTTLTHWGRDRRDGRFPIEHLVRFLTARPAELVGLRDRGRIAVGMRADLNLIDFDALTVTKPELRRDLPASGKRFHQGARGYRATIVAGEIVYRDGAPTGKRPGRLIRGPRETPALPNC